MTMAPVSGNHVVMITHQGTRARGDALLPDVKVHESTHFALCVLGEGCELEGANSDHLFKKANLLLFRELFIDRRLGIVFDLFGFDGGLSE